MYFGRRENPLWPGAEGPDAPQVTVEAGVGLAREELEQVPDVLEQPGVVDDGLLIRRRQALEVVPPLEHVPALLVGVALLVGSPGVEQSLRVAGFPGLAEPAARAGQVLREEILAEGRRANVGEPADRRPQRLEVTLAQVDREAAAVGVDEPLVVEQEHRERLARQVVLEEEVASAPAVARVVADEARVVVPGDVREVVEQPQRVGREIGERRPGGGGKAGRWLGSEPDRAQMRCEPPQVRQAELPPGRVARRP